jgi:hypothetical protein
MKRTLEILASAAFALTLLSAKTVEALPGQLFVSAQRGSDPGACVFEFPCRTLAGAMQNAPPGAEIIILDSGEYGPVSIDRAIRIEAAPGIHASIFNGGSVAISITAPDKDVITIKGLTIYGSGTGILFNSGGALHVENCLIDLQGIGTGINFFDAGQLFAHDTTIRNVSMGIQVYPVPNSATATLTRCRIEGAAVIGLRISDGVAASIRDSVISGNPGDGIFVNGSLPGGKCSLDVTDTVVTSNGNGIVCKSGNGGVPTVRVSRSTVTGNNQGLVQQGGSLESLGNNVVRGNVTDKVGTITLIPAS